MTELAADPIGTRGDIDGYSTFRPRGHEAVYLERHCSVNGVRMISNEIQHVPNLSLS